MLPSKLKLVYVTSHVKSGNIYFTKLKFGILRLLLSLDGLVMPRPFDLYPDARMGAVLAQQDGKIVSTFSRKFNAAQLKYTVTGARLLATVL
jgi:hypothetical protein